MLKNDTLAMTAVLALLIHGTRLLLLDRRLHRDLTRANAGKAAE